jgi:hypothetical protein
MRKKIDLSIYKEKLVDISMYFHFFNNFRDLICRNVDGQPAYVIEPDGSLTPYSRDMVLIGEPPEPPPPPLPLGGHESHAATLGDIAAHFLHWNMSDWIVCRNRDGIATHKMLADGSLQPWDYKPAQVEPPSGATAGFTAQPAGFKFGVTVTNPK